MNDNLVYLLFFGVTGMLFLAVAIVLFFVVYQRRLSNQQEKLRQAELEYQKKLLNASITTQEKERERIAQDLHDSVGATLSTTKLYMHQMERTEGGKFLELKTEATRLLDDTIQNIRDTTRNLLPVNLERFGLIASVADLCQRHQRYGPLLIDFIHAGEKRFDPDQELALYRIIQELLNNTLKHAQAKKVTIHINLLNDVGQLKYSDDGIGFDLERAPQTEQKGVGIKSMISRAALLNAELDWKSSPGHGFQLSLIFPIKRLKASNQKR